MGRLGQVAVGGAVLLTGLGVARWKAWPAIEKCLLKFANYSGFISGDSGDSVDSAVGSWEEVYYSPWTLQCPRTFLS